MNKSKTKGDTPQALIDARITELADWRGRTLAKLRAPVFTQVHAPVDAAVPLDTSGCDGSPCVNSED